MKALTLALILISIGVNAQYSQQYKHDVICNSPTEQLKHPKIYIPTTILVTTFTINEFSSLNQNQKTYIAITGSIISIATYLYLNKHIYKSKGKYKFKRNTN